MKKSYIIFVILVISILGIYRVIRYFDGPAITIQVYIPEEENENNLILHKTLNRYTNSNKVEELITLLETSKSVITEDNLELQYDFAIHLVNPSQELLLHEYRIWENEGNILIGSREGVDWNDKIHFSILTGIEAGKLLELVE
ncbi:MAG: hypothetical protein ATN33_06135 [Epulopiscium sp. Nele67-Bin001]|nr:MAG: hypothetical protein BEN18_06695 [Epulopiscium sp. Nuni2H_MBin001]OON93095.1 MAG: hypothetical protein ATN33_06135 [Epulopiscium sp. Nele67-Bin001]